MWEAPINLGMDKAFLIALLGFRVHGRTVGYVVFD